MRLTQPDTNVSDMAAIDPERLQKAMRGADVTETELARRIEVTPEYVMHMTKGRRRLKRNPALRRRIAQALGVPLDWIEAERPDPERGAA